MSLLENSKFSTRLKKSTTMISTNRNLKHHTSNVSFVDKPVQNKKILAEMTKDLKKKQEKLMSLEEKNLGLVELNRTLIDDLRKSQSNKTLVKKYEEQIRYLKESQKELFEETCEQKQKIKILQTKIEKYLEGNVEEKNLLREYYKSYFQDQIYKEKSKNDQIIKDLKQENDNLKQLLQVRKYDSSSFRSPETMSTSKKSFNRLENILTQPNYEVYKKKSTEKKIKNMDLIKERKSSFQLNVNNFENYDDFGVHRRMSNQMGRLETDINRLENLKTSIPESSRYENEKRKKSWINTHEDIFETLNSMKKELKLLEDFQ